MAMIIREKYLERIRPFYNSDVIKVITGIRRCGKSVLLRSIMEELSERSDNIIFLNFERSSDFAAAGTPEKLGGYVKANRKPGLCYVFLDEVQEVEGWQNVVKDLRLDSCSVFVTGSNSKLLSSEFLTLLSGRFVSFRVHPFVYEEITEYANELNITVSPNDYLIWGGFPGRFLYTGLQATVDYLGEIENTIVINDLINRYGIKKTALFKKIVAFILKNNSRILSARSIYRAIKEEDNEVSLNTVISYIDHLKEAYIINSIPQYSLKAKKELSFYEKVYDEDVCFNSLHAAFGRYDLDHNLENVVYHELIYRGYDLKVFDNNGKEIDFLASKNGKSYFVQVAYSVLDDKAYEREFEAFKSLDQSNYKILITCDSIDYSTSTVKHIKFEDFLAMSDLP